MVEMDLFMGNMDAVDSTEAGAGVEIIDLTGEMDADQLPRILWAGEVVDLTEGEEQMLPRIVWTGELVDLTGDERWEGEEIILEPLVNWGLMAQMEWEHCQCFQHLQQEPEVVLPMEPTVLYPIKQIFPRYNNRKMYIGSRKQLPPPIEYPTLTSDVVERKRYRNASKEEEENREDSSVDDDYVEELVRGLVEMDTSQGEEGRSENNTVVYDMHCEFPFFSQNEWPYTNEQ